MNEKKISLEHEPGALDPSYLLTYFVEPMQIGQTFSDWPLHITIIPWFYVKDVEALDKSLEVLAALQGVINVTGKVYGQFNEHEVCLVSPDFALKQIHRAVFARLKKLDARFISVKYFGDNYTPHVTAQGNQKLRIGDNVTLKSFYLVKRHRDHDSGKYLKTIAKSYNFGR